jgi:hypothetical protein
MLVEKLGNLAERDGGLGQAIVEQVLRVRLTFVDLELRLHPASESYPPSAHQRFPIKMPVRNTRIPPSTT